LDEAVAHQGAVNAGQPERRVDAIADQLVRQAALTPAWMVAAELAQAGLDRGRHLMGAAQRSAGAVGQGV
jgi:hypothetical protein